MSTVRLIRASLFKHITPRSPAAMQRSGIAVRVKRLVMSFLPDVLQIVEEDIHHLLEYIKLLVSHKNFP